MASRVVELPAARQRHLLPPQPKRPLIPLLVLERRYKLDIPQLPGRDLIAHIAILRLQVPLIGNHQDLAGLFCFGNNLVRVIDSTDHRLFSQHVQPFVQRGHNLLKVQCVWRRNFHRVQFDSLQHLLVVGKLRQLRGLRVALFSPLQAALIHITQSHHFGLGDVEHSPDVPAGISTTADKSHANFVHLPLFSVWLKRSPVINAPRPPSRCPDPSRLTRGSPRHRRLPRSSLPRQCPAVWLV